MRNNIKNKIKKNHTQVVYALCIAFPFFVVFCTLFYVNFIVRIADPVLLICTDPKNLQYFTCSLTIGGTCFFQNSLLFMSGICFSGRLDQAKL